MHDPMAMRPFMGYNFGKYLEHWMNLNTPERKVRVVSSSGWSSIVSWVVPLLLIDIANQYLFCSGSPHLPRQLVPQGTGRQVPVARIRRQHPRHRLDNQKTGRRRGTRSRDPDWSRPDQGTTDSLSLSLVSLSLSLNLSLSLSLRSISLFLQGSINTEGLPDIKFDELMSLPVDYWKEDSKEVRKFLEAQVIVYISLLSRATLCATVTIYVSALVSGYKI